ncbi:MAG: hypothetical protein AAB444_03460 [Patescibacteria group bacterium]
MVNEIQNTNQKSRPTDAGETLVRGADGKMYILRGGKLIPRGVSMQSQVKTPPLVVARPPAVPPNTAVSAPVSESSVSVEDELAVAGGFRLSDASATRRMKDIADAYAHGVRDDLETRAALTRLLKLGGMGMKSEAAEKVLAIFRRLPKETLKSAPSRGPRVATKTEASPSRLNISAGSAPAANVRPDTRSPVAGELDRLIGGAVQKSGLRLDDAVLARRFEMVVSARLRDVRDALETREILVREVKTGGMGFSPAEADRVGGILGDMVKKFMGVWQAREKEKTEDWKHRQVQRFEREINYGGEEDDLERRHENLLKRAGVMPSVRKSGVLKAETPSVFPPRASVPTVRVSANAIPKAPTSSKASMPVASQRAVEAVPKLALPPPPPHAKMPLPALVSKKIVSIPVLPAMRVAPFAEKPAVLTSGNPAMAPMMFGGAYMRPKVQDVRFSPRLLGPVDELKELKLADFRRLGRDAGEIVFKLRAKIDLLAEGSFAQRMDGIKALKQSEPWQLYFQLSARALESGTPVEEVIREREKRKESTLTSEEFRAIMEMNKGLRF